VSRIADEARQRNNIVTLRTFPPDWTTKCRHCYKMFEMEHAVPSHFQSSEIELREALFCSVKCRDTCNTELALSKAFVDGLIDEPPGDAAKAKKPRRRRPRKAQLTNLTALPLKPPGNEDEGIVADKEDDEDDTCCICMERAKDTTLLPCNHREMCSACAGRFGPGALCPLCRGLIEGHLSASA
jgi:hypothetical protein